MAQAATQRKKPGIEILAPAGSFDCVKAAVCCGAGAVYLGLSAFNARGNAPGFTGEELRQALALCKEHGVKAYLTLNTLTFDRERPALLETMEKACAYGFDAAIVQDLGTAKLLRECCPSMPLHASTQLSVHSLRGVEELARLGFARVVLARELSLSELEFIAKRSPLPLEVFVHGALCMSVSGQCTLSSMIGERSGNRGLCAQPCRLPCKLSAPGLPRDKRPTGKKGETEYALSLKDLSFIARLSELEKMGIASAKIEGRMKRAEYVAAAVTACQEALEGGLTTESEHRLRSVFSRGGFTQGYLLGKRDGEMFGVRGKKDVTAAAGVLDELAGLYRSEPQRIPLDMKLTLRAQEPPTLTLTDGIHTGKASLAQPPVPAKTRGTGREDAEKFLGKTGGTPYYLRSLEFDGEEGLFLAGASFNELRRNALEELRSKRQARDPHPFTMAKEQMGIPISREKPIALRGRFQQASQVFPGAEDVFEKLILPLSQLDKEEGKALAARCGEKLLVELPRFFAGDEEILLEKLKAAKELGIGGIQSGNLSGVSLAREAGLPLSVDFGGNLTNSDALTYAYEELGAREATLSFETAATDIAQLKRPVGSPMKLGVLAYGYLPLMLTRNCPVHHAVTCGECKGKAGAWLTDRTGAKMRILCQGNYSELLNSVPLYLGNRMERFPGVDFATLYFTVESREECGQVLSLFQNGEDYPGKCTAGLYYRPVR